MRLWSLHPQYLDAKGLVAAWREALLAQKVLEGKTRGYQHHPQLLRFQSHPDPLAAMAVFLNHLYTESKHRAYHFDLTKIGQKTTHHRLPVTNGQLAFEWEHLKQKLRQRDPIIYQKYINIEQPDPNPLFYLVEGSKESWEKG